MLLFSLTDYLIHYSNTPESHTRALCNRDS
uniref:Uncharacterized protein n=1 Tax=Anguilla anguilla TaxID=7936 RepID=A0A0E9R7U7_ANGAN